MSSSPRDGDPHPPENVGAPAIDAAAQPAPFELDGKRAASVESVLGAAVMGVLVLITLGNVVVRYLSDQSFAWTEEISVFLLVVLTLAGTAWTIANDGHIRIDYFFEKGSAAHKRSLGLFFGLMTLVLFALLAVLMARAGLEEYEFAETTMGTGAPRWWYTAGLMPVAVWVVVRAAGHLRRLSRSSGASDQGAAP